MDKVWKVLDKVKEVLLYGAVILFAIDWGLYSIFQRDLVIHYQSKTQGYILLACGIVLLFLPVIKTVKKHWRT